MKIKKGLKERGITLIALVLIIIILLILAGITIGLVTGDNGILTQTQRTKDETEKANESEIKKLAQLEASTHLEEYEYTDSDGKKVKIPAECAVLNTNETNTVKKGLVIIDKSGNEWVYIEVPKSIYKMAKFSTDYDNILKDMEKYSSDYQSSFSEEWMSEEQFGFESKEEYNELKEKMLKSVYENGGFYIGRYETGSIIPRLSSNEGETGVAIKQDIYLYNFVLPKEAQSLSEKLAVKGKTSSLTFKIQESLLMKFLEENAEELGNTKEERMRKLKVDSTDFGNYSNAKFNVNRGYYSILDQIDTWEIGNYNKVSRTYLKDNVGTSNVVLLSTGASERNKTSNIYDLAGNVAEWVLETNPNDGTCAVYGGGCFSDGISGNIFKCWGLKFSNVETTYDVGFRTVMF